MKAPKKYLLGALVDALHERGEHILAQQGVVELGDQGSETDKRLLLISLEHALNIELLEDLLDSNNVSLVAAAVVGVEDLALLGGGLGEGLVDQPGALVVLDVGADLANDFGQAVAVQVVVLDLEVLAQGQQDLLGLLEGGLVLDAGLIGKKIHAIFLGKGTCIVRNTCSVKKSLASEIP